MLCHSRGRCSWLHPDTDLVIMGAPAGAGCLSLPLCDSTFQATIKGGWVGADLRKRFPSNPDYKEQSKALLWTQAGEEQHLPWETGARAKGTPALSPAIGQTHRENTGERRICCCQHCLLPRGRRREHLPLPPPDQTDRKQTSQAASSTWKAVKKPGTQTNLTEESVPTLCPSW